MYLVTGGTGFIGQAVIEQLTVSNLSFVAAVRLKSKENFKNINIIEVGSIEANTDWSRALVGIKYVIHTAARVHIMHDTSINHLEEYRKINVAGTLNLAKQAVSQGVKRFIFISSIKVNGEYTINENNAFKADSSYKPIDPYGLSKYEAEEGLKEISKNTGLEIVIIRPPLVYGPGVKANFRALMKWIDKGVPLPFGSINNKRSLVALDNLVNLIFTCIDHPNAKNQTFLICDGEDISTGNLSRRIAQAMNKKICLLPIPNNILETLANIFGKKDIAQKLCRSMQVDMSKTCEILNWKPIVTVDEGLVKTVNAYINENR